MAKFKPVVDGDKVYGEGDWRPILGENPRKNEWKVYIVGKQSVEHGLRGIIFPSHDWDLELEDASFPGSVGKCWTDETDNKAPRHLVPNAFAVPLLMYPYLGENKEHWLSPRNRLNMIGNDTLDPDDACDAFDDLNRWVRRNKAFSQEKKDFFLKTESMSDDPLIPGRTARYFILGQCMDKENGWHDAVTVFTSSAYSYMIEQMRWWHMREEMGEPRDPDWPRYMLGDPTDPKGALVWHVEKMKVDPKDVYDTNALCFTQQREILDREMQTRQITQEMLDKRFLLCDPANWNFPTYEEQVEHMIETFDAAVTMDMIAAAVGHRYRGDLPSERPQRIRLQGGSPPPSPDEHEPAARTSREESAQEEAPAPKRSLAPSAGSPPMPPAEDVAAAGDPDKVYWTGKAGSHPTKLTVADLQGLVDRGETDGYKVMLEKDDWRTIEESGLVKIPEPENVVPLVPTDEALPAVPVDDAPPSVPADEAPPSVPDTAAADTPAEVGGALTLLEMKERLFPNPEDYDGLADGAKAEADKLIEDAWNATDQGRSDDMPAEIVDRMLAIMGG